MHLTIDEIQAEIDRATLVVAPVAELHPADRNPRHNTHAADRLAETVKATGWGAPPLVQKSSGKLIAGHTRLQAAAKLGLERLPVLVLDVDDRRAKALQLADNRLGELAGWDWPGLAEDLGAFGLEEAEALGFDSKYLEDLADKVENFGPLDREVVVEDEVPDVPTTPITKPGDTWRLGDHVLRCADCRTVTDYQGDCVITDPPYGVSYVGKTSDALEIQNDESTGVGIAGMMHAVHQWVDAGAIVYVFSPPGPDSLDFGVALRDAGILRQKLVWVKQTLVLGHSDYHYRHEDLLYGWKPGASHSWLSDRRQTSVLEFDRPTRSVEHPTMKPVALIAYLIENSTKKDHVVCDPFLGSGTAIIAAEQLGRRCVGTEIDPAYCDVIVERWTSLTGRGATRAESH